MNAPPRIALAAIGLGLLSALFFTSSYVLNRAAALEHGHWAWTASLRYLITLPLMLPLMRGRMRPVLAVMRARPGPWLAWGGVGFVLFHTCLSWAAASGPAWLVAGTFQLTVVAGMLCAPFLYRDERRRIPPAALALGLLAVGGVLLMQLGHGGGHMDASAWAAMAAVAIAAVAYPLGNRGLLLYMERAGIELDATQRVFGMTLASIPLWMPVVALACWQAGPPPVRQVLFAGGAALGAGIIATVLFFRATGLVRRDPTALAATEAMQAAEILFATAIGVLWLGEPWPRGAAAVGALVVVAAIVLFSRVAARRPRPA